MPVLERSELEASPLADLHTIANQIGIDGFRRLRKADLIDAILKAGPSGPDAQGEEATEGGPAGRRRFGRRRKVAEEEAREGEAARAEDDSAKAEDDSAKAEDDSATADRRSARAGRDSARAGRASKARAKEESETEDDPEVEAPRRRSTANGRSRTSSRSRTAEPRDGAGEEDKERTVEGVIELQPNGSAFLRPDGEGQESEEVYVSAAQVRRCELVAGDRVAGPMRMPRRSERYPSLVRVETVNGIPASELAEGPRYEDLKAVHPTERLELGSDDPTLRAIEWLTPLGRGSRAMIVGAPRSGKTETLRRIVNSLATQDGLEVALVLTGIRPEELADWDSGPATAVSRLTLSASQDAQAQALERAIETGKRVAARGGHAVLAVDCIDHIQPGVARRALAAARKLEDGGSLTVIATGLRELGGESTVIALDVALTSSGHHPAIDLAASGTIRPDLLVGEEGSRAIAEARAAALES